MSKFSFTLSKKFVEKYKNKKVPWGFGVLGELVYLRTYSRIKDEDNSNEKWFETVERVVNGTYSMQKDHIEQYDLGWNAWQAQRSAQEMYDRMYHMKFLPPGRGLWAMGSSLTTEKKIYAALNNCAFYSTKDLKDEPTKPFCFLMDMSMLGVGVGFDTEGAGKLLIQGPNKKREIQTFTIPDSREGWVESLKLLLESHFQGTAPVDFNFSEIRQPGLPIKGFGGVSSGPEPLKECLNDINDILTNLKNETITSRVIVDIMNIIGCCVVAGNVRRTAEISFGSPEDEEYLDLKNYNENPERGKFGWTSNNSIFAKIGMNYYSTASRTKINGEPGFAWLQNMQDYSRMGEEPDFKDHRVRGGNPCLEQSLETAELCCLVETFPFNHDNKEDYLKTLKFAYLYAKTVTLGKTHWPETNRVLLRNRRIGCSMSGIAQFVSKYGLDTLKGWMEDGYEHLQNMDIQYSDWFAIPRSIKTTSIKPSGTVSLLAGATPGMHYPESRFYIRRMRLSIHSELLPSLEKAGYKLEPASDDKKNTIVVEIPVDVGNGIKTTSELSIWEQMSLAAFIQKYWADNQVSCTVTFDPEKEAEQIETALNYFQYQLKGISFLPKLKKGAFKQMPYEEITEDVYLKKTKDLKKISFKKQIHNEKADIEKFCDGGSCILPEVKI